MKSIAFRISLNGFGIKLNGFESHLGTIQRNWTSFALTLHDFDTFLNNMERICMNRNFIGMVGASSQIHPAPPANGLDGQNAPRRRRRWHSQGASHRAFEGLWAWRQSLATVALPGIVLQNSMLRRAWRVMVAPESQDQVKTAMCQGVVIGKIIVF